MGTYLQRKEQIESNMAQGIDSLTKQLSSDMAATEVYNESEKRSRQASLIEAYNQKIEAEHDKAIKEEAALFDELRKAVEAALTKAPTEEQTRYLNALSIKQEITPADIEAASRVVAGNALAVATLGGLSASHGIDNYTSDQPSIKAIEKGLEEFQERRTESIKRYGTVDANGKPDEWFEIAFLPSGSCKAFDEAERVIEQYSAS